MNPERLSGIESICTGRDLLGVDCIPGSRRYPGRGNGNSLQYSCLDNPMGRGAWWAIVHSGAELDMTENTPKLKKEKL